MLNVLDLDSHGREAYGGVTRDLKWLDEHPACLPDRLGSPSSSWHGSNPLALLILPLAYPALILAKLGIVGTEMSLSCVGDTCTLPLVPVLNRFDAAFLRKPPAVLPENLPGSASEWLRQPWVQRWAPEDVEPTVTPSASASPLSEQPSPPKSRPRDELPPLLSTPEVRQGMARWQGDKPEPWWSEPSGKE
jgi:hypothetical protein